MIHHSFTHTHSILVAHFVASVLFRTVNTPTRVNAVITHAVWPLPRPWARGERGPRSEDSRGELIQSSHHPMWRLLPCLMHPDNAEFSSGGWSYLHQPPYSHTFHCRGMPVLTSGKRQYSCQLPRSKTCSTHNNTINGSGQRPEPTLAGEGTRTNTAWPECRWPPLIHGCYETFIWSN